MTEKTKPTGLDLMRAPFEPNQISKLPKPTKRQTDEVKADFSKGIRCDLCGGWHHPKVVHLDYVGHAALTDRLLDCDPNWNWEPVAFDERGSPAVDNNGGMWIRLTVCDQTRLGYGSADGKKGGDAVKELIGDALRNAAMRFGAALDLWHKGDLHVDDEPEPEQKPQQRKPDPKPSQQQAQPQEVSKNEIEAAIDNLNKCADLNALKTLYGGLYKSMQHIAEHKGVVQAKDVRKSELEASA